MSKELEALNELRNKCCDYLSLSMDRQVCESFKTIETALKEQDKNKKAIEIIKENVLINVIEMQGQYFIKLGIGENVIPITKEKALILKEALL